MTTNSISRYMYRREDMHSKVHFKVGDSVVLVKNTTVGKVGNRAIVTKIEPTNDWWMHDKFIRIVINDDKNYFDWVGPKDIK